MRKSSVFGRGASLACSLLIMLVASAAQANGPTISAGSLRIYSNASAPCKAGQTCLWANGNQPNFRKSDGTDLALGGGATVPLVLADAASPLGVPLLKVTDNSGANVYFSVSAAATGAAVLDFIDGASAGLSAAGHGTLIYDNTLHVFRASLNGGAYATLGGGGASFPLTNGTSTTSFNYAGTMTGSSTAYSMDSTNAYTTGDVALNIKSAGTSALKIGFNFGAAFPEIQSQTANILMLTINGDGWACQGANLCYWYGASATQIEFLANNGMRPVSSFPLYNGTVDAPWSSVGSKWEAAPLGASLTSASTVTPTQSAHPLTGTTTVNTIATTNIPTGTATVVVSETFICAAACVFGTSGNISYGFTGVAGGSYTFIWNGTSWIPPAATTVPPADNTGSIGTTSPLMRWTTFAGLTLTAGSTGLTLIGASTSYLLNATGLDLSGSGSWSIASQNATAFSFGKSGITSTAKGSFALATQAATMTATTTVTPSSGGVVKLTYASTVNVTTMTLSAGVDGQELVVMLIQPAAGTAATMATTWTNVNFAAGVGSFTATLAKRDVYAFVYDGTTSKWYERSRSLNEPN